MGQKGPNCTIGDSRAGIKLVLLRLLAAFSHDNAQVREEEENGEAAFSDFLVFSL